jgi:hypothetical protein
MDITYTWEIGAFECKPRVGALDTYIIAAHWRCRGVDDEGHVGTAYSTVAFPVVENKPDFVPYDEITEAQALQWVKDVLGEAQVAAVYAGIDQQIEAQISPPTITPALPWQSGVSIPPIEE